MDFLEYPKIKAEINGCMVPGKLKLTYQYIAFKNDKTGIVTKIPATNFEEIKLQRFGDNLAIRVFERNGTFCRFVGFNENEKEKIEKFLKINHKIEVEEETLSTLGWNWGHAEFKGSSLQFRVNENNAFEIPLTNVSQCLANRNEVALEFHQNEDAPVSLMEMRFHISTDDMANDFRDEVLKKANIKNPVEGALIAIFSDIQCITPRGRYDLKIFGDVIQLHGKTFDYKIPTSTIINLFLLSHRDKRQMYFILHLAPPIRQGQTRYHFLIFIFNMEDTTSIDLLLSEETLQTTYKAKLEKTLSGESYNVVSKLVKIVTNKNIIGTSTFIGKSGTHALSCSYKTAAGYLYPLEEGMLYIYKPPIYLKFKEIVSVNFTRGESSHRSFDIEVELESTISHVFSNIAKEDYKLLFNFLSNKKIEIKKSTTKVTNATKQNYSDEDNQPVTDKEVRDESSTDGDFNPDQEEENDITDEETSDEENIDVLSFETKESKPSTFEYSNKPKTMKKAKKIQDKDKPKRPQTAFMLWLNENRNKIKSKNPDMKVTEIAKEGGRQWRELEDKSKWESKAKDAKRLYEEAMKTYKAKQDVD